MDIEVSHHYVFISRGDIGDKTFSKALFGQKLFDSPKQAKDFWDRACTESGLAKRDYPKLARITVILDIGSTISLENHLGSV